MSAKLTVIGIDAGTFDVLDPLIEAGELPNLRRVFGAGSRGLLRSTVHPITSQAWATAFTGVNAARHGLWEFSERDESGYRLRLVNGSYRRARAVWDYLTDAGVSVGVVNVPFTWPAQQVDGFMVSGLDSGGREGQMAYPPELVDELREQFGQLELDHTAPVNKEGAILLDRVQGGIDQVKGVAKLLRERFDPDVLIVVFMAVDQCQHYGWAGWEKSGSASPLAQVCRLVDGAVGELLEDAEGDVVVVSDHGGGRAKGVVNLNAWLADQGLLEYAGPIGLAPSEVGRQALFGLLELRRKVVPKSVRYRVKQHVPRLREKVSRVRDLSAVDWSHTRAFAYGDMGNIVINVRGREQHGIVEPGEEYERLCDEIAAQALEMTSPVTGERIVAAVHRREDLFEGPFLEKIPDLIIEFKDYAWMGKGNQKRAEAFVPITDEHPYRGTTGSHRPDGLLALSGPSIQPGAGFGARIEDVAPTILYLTGAPIPTGLDGRLLEEVIDPELLSTRPPNYHEPEEAAFDDAIHYSDEDAGVVEGRLRDLGYLE
jgi:predicted AlkP superfamily phosphohydrolase/phosphomutase